MKKETDDLSMLALPVTEDEEPLEQVDFRFEVGRRGDIRTIQSEILTDCLRQAMPVCVLVLLPYRCPEVFGGVSS